MFSSPTGHMLWSSFGFFLINLRYILMDSSKMIGDFHEVSMNINRLFFKLNRFICNLAVGSPHSLSQTPITPKISIQFQPWNWWGLCWELDVGPPLFTLLQPEMPTDGVWTSWCDQPLKVFGSFVRHWSTHVEQGELTASYKWTSWVWEITYRLMFIETSPSF